MMAIGKLRYPKFTHLSDLGSLVLCVLVVPVLEVLVDSGLLAICALAQHGGETTSLLGGATVHDLVEGSITVVVFLLERVRSHCVERKGVFVEEEKDTTKGTIEDAVEREEKG
jgi:hypothetical protein